MEDRTVNKSGGTSRRVKILLGVSLAANLAVVGVLGGAMLRHSKGEPGRDRGLRGPAFIQALEPADRRTLVESMRAGRDGSRTQQREQMQRLVAALRANEFDREAMKAALSARADTSRATQAGAHDTWLSIVSGMSVQQRVEYADRLEQALQRRGGERRR